jgi:DNA adenine methylase
MNIKKPKAVMPFLKWAGGKRWLVDNHQELLSKKFNRFIEPFLGSGAVFFNILPDNAILSDKNEELINTYKAIKKNWKLVEEKLISHHSNHNKEYYYDVRRKLPNDIYEKAARLIYLNRTCWNGLYRVNSKGEFNVPIGSKQNVILNSDNFKLVSDQLKNVKIFCEDFEKIIDLAGEGDFLFIDPPYTVKHNHNGFVKYNQSLFSWQDQIRLRDSIVRALDRGADALITNANHDSIREIYSDIGDHLVLSRASVISGSNVGRGVFEEMVIKCY